MLIPSLIAPFAGLVIAAALMIGITWLIRRRSPGLVNRVFRRLQLVSGGFVAFTHGTNDAQKTMGIIALALITSGHLAPGSDPPLWVIVSAAIAMGAGTYAGGWRIIKTLGTRIAKLDPPQGFAAQTACASILWTTAHFGFPVSTTQTITGSVMGAGASRRLSAVRWGVAGNIVVAWVMTIPCAGAVGALMEVVTRLPAGDAIVFVLAVAIAWTAFAARRWQARRLVRRARLAAQQQPALAAGWITGSPRCSGSAVLTALTIAPCMPSATSCVNSTLIGVEAGRLEPGLVLALRERAGDAADVAAALGALLGARAGPRRRRR